VLQLHPRNVPEWTTKNGNEPPKQFYSLPIQYFCILDTMKRI